MKEFNVIIIDQDGEMKDMQRYSCLSTAVQDAQEYVRLYPQAQVGVYRWTENVAQYFPDKGEWWIKTGSKWERGEPENLTKPQYTILRGKGTAGGIPGVHDCEVDCIGKRT